MKKLLLILSAVFVSVSIRSALLDPNTGWDYLNPYAYDLKSEVINNGQTLHLTYKFNAPGFGNRDVYNKLNPKDGTGTGRGIQIYLLYKDEQGNWQRVQKDDNTGDYAIYSGGYDAAQAWSVEVNVIDIPDNCKGKELTWEAVVHGNIGRTKPKLVKATTTKPTNAYGIAVNNDPTHVRFAQMFVSEAYPNKRDDLKLDGWKKWGETDEYKYANSMLEYTPLLGFQCAHFKHYHNDTEKSHFASLWDWTNKYGELTITSTYSYNYEPNRIKVSEDGRTFVSSFHPKASCVVLEYGKKRDEYNGHHFYNTIDNNWENNKDLDNISDKVEGNYNPFLYRRCVGMDVKGKGDDLKIILLWIDANAANYTISGKTVPAAKFIIYEYELGLAEAEGYIATNKYLPPFDNTGCKYVHKIGEYSWDYQGWSSGGAFYQGARFGIQNNDKRYLYNNMLRGFADLAYGTNDDVWVKIDYCAETTAKPKIIRVKLNNGTTTEYTINNGSTANYGGSGILIKDGMLITSPTNSTICLYEINANGELNATNKQPDAKHTIIDNQIGSWVTGFATDYAGNLFALTQASINGENYTANILGIAMPYKTKTAITTRAKGTFTLADPVPNILATDLKYEPVGTTDKYIFSFITNTKPTNAEIRFYKKENIGTMNSNIATIHADTYNKGKDATTLPDYVYTFSPEDCKQGLMSATFKMVGGDVNSKVVIDALPPGEMYWSVYVETEKSTCFAPIYRSASYKTGTFHPLHATVNNYPETDMFGSLFVANNSDRSTKDRKTNGLLVYGLNPSGNANEFKLDDCERYEMRANYLNERITSGLLNYPRRMAVAPDGKVYIADEGATPENWVGDFKGYKPVVVFSKGGIKVWDPKQPTQISTFTGGKINTASGVAFWGDPTNKDSWKIYYSNTYDEFSKHVSNDKSNYTEEQQDNPTYYDGTNNGGYGWNGLVVHQIGNSKPLKELALGMGDASGNISVVAMEKGVWLCQYREHTVIIKDNLREPYADNMGAYLLSFVPYGADNRSTTYNPRTWTSCTTHGRTWSGSHPNFTYKDFDKSWWSQTQSSPLQSTPGGGLAYRKIDGEEFLFVVNHDGNIVKIKIDGWTGSGKLVKPTMTADNDRVEILQTPGYTKCTKQAKKDIIQNGKVVHTYGPYNWTTSYINSMEFDYAGNLVTVTGSAASHASATHEIIIYTMPYDRTNAQEIRAPESCIYIPERLHQMAMEEVDIQGVLNRHTSDGACAVDLYRPLQGGMFNTICLPFVLEMDHLNNPLAGSEVREFTRATIESIGGEKILCLEFAEVSTIQCNIPYIIKPQQNIKQIMRFNWPVTLAKSTEVKPIDSDKFDTDNKITYQGILPKTQVDALYDPNTNLPLRLILVADNRLAVLTGDGEMYGFRGYFDLAKPLPPGTVAKISAKKDTPTNTTIVVDGKKVNIDKYLREGRVYIRVGDSLYTVDGQLVK